MPYTLAVSFDEFYKAINLPGDHRGTANSRRLWIEKQLKSKFDVLETLSFGSVPRFTALQDHADVDVLVALHYTNHIKNRKPSEVLKAVRDALSGYATSVRRNGQAVTLRFKSWPNVDIVPAIRVAGSGAGAVSYFNIPDMHREVWLRSDPKSHARRVDGKASDCGAGFKRAITMMKHWNRLKNSGRLQSFHIEAIAADTFSSPMTDLPWEIHQFFQAALGKLSFHWYDDADITAYLDWSTKAEVMATMNEASNIATQAWLAGYRNPGDHEEAIKLWRKVFGLKYPAYGSV